MAAERKFFALQHNFAFTLFNGNEGTIGAIVFQYAYGAGRPPGLATEISKMACRNRDMGSTSKIRALTGGRGEIGRARIEYQVYNFRIRQFPRSFCS